MAAFSTHGRGHVSTRNSEVIQVLESVRTGLSPNSQSMGSPSLCFFNYKMKVVLFNSELFYHFSKIMLVKQHGSQ